MSRPRLTTFQRLRLALFLGASGLLLGGTLVGLFGLSALNERDVYTIAFDGSVSGLAVGSTLKYNGIDVGRVEGLRIPEDRVSGVLARVSLEGATPIFSDTVAVLHMQGITGLKYIELSSPGHGERLPPGAQIRSTRSSVDALSESAGRIAESLERVLGNLAVLTGPGTHERVQDVFDRISAVGAETHATVAELRPMLRQVAADAQAAARRTDAAMAAAQASFERFGRNTDQVAAWVNPAQVRELLDGLRTTARGAQETLAATKALAERGTALAHNADLALLRAKDDLLRVLASAVEGADRFTELAELLRDNPSVLLTGVEGEDRKP